MVKRVPESRGLDYLFEKLPLFSTFFKSEKHKKRLINILLVLSIAGGSGQQTIAQVQQDLGTILLDPSGSRLIDDQEFTTYMSATSDLEGGSSPGFPNNMHELLHSYLSPAADQVNYHRIQNDLLSISSVVDLMIHNQEMMYDFFSIVTLHQRVYQTQTYQELGLGGVHMQSYIDAILTPEVTSYLQGIGSDMHPKLMLEYFSFLNMMPMSIRNYLHDVSEIVNNIWQINNNGLDANVQLAAFQYLDMTDENWKTQNRPKVLQHLLKDHKIDQQGYKQRIDAGYHHEVSYLKADPDLVQGLIEGLQLFFQNPVNTLSPNEESIISMLILRLETITTDEASGHQFMQLFQDDTFFNAQECFEFLLQHLLTGYRFESIDLYYSDLPTLNDGLIDLLKYTTGPKASMYNEFLQILITQYRENTHLMGWTGGDMPVNKLTVIYYLYRYMQYLQAQQSQFSSSTDISTVVGFLNGDSAIREFDAYYQLIQLTDMPTWTQKREGLGQLYSQFYFVTNLCNPKYLPELQKIIDSDGKYVSVNIPLDEEHILIYSATLKLLGFYHGHITSDIQELLPALKRYVYFQTQIGIASEGITKALDTFVNDQGDALLYLANVYLGIEDPYYNIDNIAFHAFYSALERHVRTTDFIAITNPKDLIFNNDPESYIKSLDLEEDVYEGDVAVTQLYMRIGRYAMIGSFDLERLGYFFGWTTYFYKEVQDYLTLYYSSHVNGFDFSTLEVAKQEKYKTYKVVGEFYIDYLTALHQSIAIPAFADQYEKQRKLIEQRIAKIDDAITYGRITGNEFNEVEFINQLFCIDVFLGLYGDEADAYYKAVLDGQANKLREGLLSGKITGEDAITQFLYVVYKKDFYGDDNFAQYDSNHGLQQTVFPAIINPATQIANDKVYAVLDSTFVGLNNTEYHVDQLNSLQGKLNDWNLFRNKQENIEYFKHIFFKTGQAKNTTSQFSYLGSYAPVTYVSSSEKQSYIHSLTNYFDINTSRTYQESQIFVLAVYKGLEKANLVGEGAERAKKKQLKTYKKLLNQQYTTKYGPGAPEYYKEEIDLKAEQMYSQRFMITFYEIALHQGILTILSQYSDTVDTLGEYIEEHWDELGDEELVGLRYLYLADIVTGAGAGLSPETINTIVSNSTHMVMFMVAGMPSALLVKGLYTAAQVRFGVKLIEMSLRKRILFYARLGIIQHASITTLTTPMMAPLDQIPQAWLSQWKVKDVSMAVFGVGAMKYFGHFDDIKMFSPQSNFMPVLNKNLGTVLRITTEEGVMIGGELIITKATGAKIETQQIIEGLAMTLSFEAIGGWMQRRSKGRVATLSVEDGNVTIQHGDHSFLPQDGFNQAASDAGYSDPSQVIMFVDSGGHLHINQDIWKDLSDAERKRFLHEERVHQLIMRLETQAINDLLVSFQNQGTLLDQAIAYLASQGVDLSGMQPHDIINEIIADYCGRMAHQPPIITIFDREISNILSAHNLDYLIGLQSIDMIMGYIGTHSNVNDDFVWANAAAGTTKRVQGPRSYDTYPDSYTVIGGMDQQSIASVHGNEIILNGQPTGIFIYFTPDGRCYYSCDHHGGTTSFSDATSTSMTLDFINKILIGPPPTVTILQSQLTQSGIFWIDGQAIDVSNLGSELSLTFLFDTDTQQVILTIVDENGSTITTSYQPSIVTFLQTTPEGIGLYNISQDNGSVLATTKFDKDENGTTSLAENPLSAFEQVVIIVDGQEVTYTKGDIRILGAEPTDHRWKVTSKDQDSPDRVVYGAMINAHYTFIKKFPQLAFKLVIGGVTIKYPKLTKLLTSGPHTISLKGKLTNYDQCVTLIEKLLAHKNALESILQNETNPDAQRFLQTQIDVIDGYIEAITLAKEHFSVAQTMGTPGQTTVRYDLGDGSVKRSIKGQEVQRSSNANPMYGAVWSRYINILTEGDRAERFFFETQGFGIPGFPSLRSSTTGQTICQMSDPVSPPVGFSGKNLDNPQDLEFGRRNPDYYTFEVTHTTGQTLTCVFYENHRQINYIKHETVSKDPSRPYIIVQKTKKGFIFSLGGNAEAFKQVDLEKFVDLLILGALSDYMKKNFFPDATKPLVQYSKDVKKLKDYKDDSPIEQATIQAHLLFSEYVVSLRNKEPANIVQQKKRKALEAMSRLLQDFPPGASFVPLGPNQQLINNLYEMTPTLVGTLGGASRTGYVNINVSDPNIRLDEQSIMQYANTLQTFYRQP